MESTTSKQESSLDDIPSSSKSHNAKFNYVEEPIDDDEYECKPNSKGQKNPLEQMFSMMGMNESEVEGENLNMGEMMEKITKQFENMPDMEGLKDDFITNNIEIDKEHVYKPIKFATQKFPEFLRNNYSKLTKDELKKYNEQFRLLNLICLEFEKNKNESLSPENESKIKEMMMKLNSLGDLPKETICETEVLQDLDEQLERMFKNLGEADIGFSEETGDAGLNGKASESDKDSFLHPIMHQFLKQMLAKSMMYPSLKHITTKFPEWLRENLTKLNTEDKKKYIGQFKLLTIICLEYEKYSDEDELSPESLEKLSRLLESVNELGECPKEIVPKGIQLDSFAKMGGGSNPQCSIM